MSLSRVLLLAVLLPLALVGCKTPPSKTDAAFEIKRIHESLSLPPGTEQISIYNDFGTVYVKKLKDPQSVGIHAIVQTPPGEDPPEVVIVPGDAPHSARLEVRPLPGRQLPLRVDLAAYVPVLPAVAVETKHGDVFAKRVLGNLSVRTTRGNILASSAGRLQLSSVDGAVRATQIGGKWLGAASLRSEHGLVELGIPADAPAQLQVTAHGGLQHNFGDLLKPVAGQADQWSGSLRGEGQLQTIEVFAGGEAVIRRSDQR